VRRHPRHHQNGPIAVANGYRHPARELSKGRAAPAAGSQHIREKSRVLLENRPISRPARAAEKQFGKKFLEMGCKRRHFDYNQDTRSNKTDR
jgi:hypothetical protein